MSSVFQDFSAPAAPAPVAERLAALRTALRAMGFDGMLVPYADAFQSEYLPASEARLAWLTGFTGSAGFAVVLAEKAALFVDGRYTVQAAAQTDVTAFTCVPVHEQPVHEWLRAEVPTGARIGFDPHLISIREHERFSAAIERAGATLVALSPNPIDALWHDRPAAPASTIHLHPPEFAGTPAAEKIAAVQAALGREGLAGVVITRTTGVAWLLNIRANDVSHLPIALAQALVPASGPAVLVAAPTRLSAEARTALGQSVTVIDPQEFPGALGTLPAGGKLRLATDQASIALKSMVEAAGLTVDAGADPSERLQALKNETEISGARAAHRRDGIALTRFLAWFDRTVEQETLTEIDAAVRLETFRRETNVLADLSFDTISAAGPHAALPHYRVSEASNLPITPGLFLIDSGGQYRDGTTDVTRTLAVGMPDAEMIRHNTLVLKGLIALSEAIFPQKTTGAQLDVLARQFLWREGLDYAHGTGHGVGAFLSVHEGPQRFSKLGHAPLEPGMVLSIEPGYYREGAYGIRQENLVLVVERIIPGTTVPSLALETLTLAPFDKRLIDVSLLTGAEIGWLNAYHARVAEVLGPDVPEEDRAWFDAATSALDGETGAGLLA